MKYKALILDLDGTTVDSSGDSLPSGKVRAAIQEAKKHLVVTVATGRPLYYCQHVLDALKIEAPCVLNGGAEIIDLKTGDSLFKKFISPMDQQHAYDVLKQFGVQIFTSKQQYRQPIGDVGELNEEVAKLFIGAVAKDKALEIVQALEAADGVIGHLTTSWSKGDVVDIHVTNAQATKKHAIGELLKILKVKKSETIGIGDYHNDLPLLESVGLKIVMGSAPKELKAVADYVVGDLEHDGVAEAIERFILA